MQVITEEKVIEKIRLPGLSKKNELDPVTGTERINSLDVIRGIAVLGILIMNVVGFGLAFAYEDPTVSGGSHSLNYKVWAFTEIFVEGTMRGLFTMLFGVGFMIFVSRGEKKGIGLSTADYYYRRILWLLVFGLIHAYVLLWHGEILFTYAICGLMLFAFRKMKPALLVAFTVVLLLAGTIQFFLDYENKMEIYKQGQKAQDLVQKSVPLSDEQTYFLNEYRKEVGGKLSSVAKENNMIRHGDYFSIMKYRYPRSMQNQTTYLYKYNIWDSLSFMLLGMAFFTWGIFHGRRSFRFYLIMALVGYAVGFTVNFYEVELITSSNYDSIVMSRAKLTYHLGRLFTTLGHIGVFMIFIKSGVLKFLQNALASVGKMAFTNYLVQTLICVVIFMGFGFGLFGRLQRFELYYIVVAIWIFQLIYSPLWFRYFKYGPMEWLWRSLTYGKIQRVRA